MLRVADPRSGARLCEAQRFMVPMHVQKRKETLHEPNPRSAGLQAAISPTSSRRPCGLEIRDTADWKSALPTSTPVHVPIHAKLLMNVRPVCTKDFWTRTEAAVTAQLNTWQETLRQRQGIRV